MSMNEAPEFKGNVKTFRTDLLVAKTDEELSATSGQNAELWKKTGGDASYHYYGSAIWFTRIGHAMGESMLELMKGKPWHQKRARPAKAAILRIRVSIPRRRKHSHARTSLTTRPCTSVRR